MKKKTIKMGILILLVIIVISFPKILNNKKVINTSESSINKRQFSMYKQKTDKTGYEKITNSAKIPEGYLLNTGLSYCLDNNGEKVNSLIKFQNNKISITSNKTVFCTFYFDLANVLGNVLKNSSNSVEYKGAGWSGGKASEKFFNNNIYYYTDNGSYTKAEEIKNSWNVLFGGYCWQMIRTTDSGGVKLLFNGDPVVTVDSNNNMVYSCDDNRSNNRFGLRSIDSTNVTGFSNTTQFAYGDSYSYDNGTYSLKNVITSTWTEENASNLIGKYTCKSAESSNCSKIYKIFGYADATRASAAEVVNTIAYNMIASDGIGTLESIASAAYMHNEILPFKYRNFNVSYYPLTANNSGTTEKNISTQAVSGASNYYFSDTYLYGTDARPNCSNCYKLDGTTTGDNPTLVKGSTLLNGGTDYSKLVGKYTLKNGNAATNNFNYIYYVLGYNGTTLYLLQLKNNNAPSYYDGTLKLSKTATLNNNGTYTLGGDITTIQKLDWWRSNTSNDVYKDYYMCANGSETCDAYYITKSTYDTVTAELTSNRYNFSNSYTYDENTGKYTLDMSDSNSINIWDLVYKYSYQNPNNENNVNKIGKAHYVCLDDTNNHYPVVNATECTWIGYSIYVDNGTTLEYLPLSEGQYVYTDQKNSQKFKNDKNVLYKLLYAPDVNKDGSKQKIQVDSWYEENLIDYEDYLDKTEIYCADRSSSNNFGSWNLNSENITTPFNFGGPGYIYNNNTNRYDYNLNCQLRTDSLSAQETEKGNGALKYPIALATRAEISNLGSYAPNIKTSGYSAYYLMTPVKFGPYGYVYRYQENGIAQNALLSHAYGTRPVIALINNLEYVSGDGSQNNPYVVDALMHNLEIDNNVFNVSTKAYKNNVIQIIDDIYEVTSFKLNGTLINGNTFTMPGEDVLITDVTYNKVGYNITNTDTDVIVPATAKVGTTVTLTSNSYAINSFKMNGTLISGNSFTMPGEDVVITDIDKTAQVIVESEHNPYPLNLNNKVYYENTFEGATSLTVELTYETEYIYYDWIYLYDSSNGEPIDNKKYGNSPTSTETININGNYLKIVFNSDDYDSNYYGFKAVITPHYD